MAKSKNGNSFVVELLRAGLYKRNQGRLARQITAVGSVLLVFYGAWTLSQGPLSAYGPTIKVGVPLLLSGAGAWIIYRLVNFPRFADFLISVEAEMDKVSWASRDELFRATAVVLGTMVFLGFVLLGYDIFWSWFFRLIGFLRLNGS